MAVQVEPLPKFFSLQAHLYKQQQEASEASREAERNYAACVEVRVQRIQNVVRSVVSKELGILPHMLGPEQLPYLSAEFRWALRHWRVKASPRDLLLVSHLNPGERPEEAKVDQDLLVLSDREIAKRARAQIKQQKECSAESLKSQARMLNQKARRAAEMKVYRLEAQLVAARKQLEKNRIL